VVQGVEDKHAALRQIAEETGVLLDAMAFVGNDLNDRPALENVALPIIVQDSHPDVIGYETYRTHTAGGKGAVREVCDMFERVLNGVD